MKKSDDSIPSVDYRPHDERSEGVEVVSFESLYARSNATDVDPFAPHRVQFHHLMYVAKGRGNHYIDFDHCELKAGTFVLVNKNQVHAFDRKCRVQGVMVLFTQQFLDSIHATLRMPVSAFGVRLLTSSPVIRVDAQMKKSCAALLSEISIIGGNERDDSLILQLLLACLFLKLRQCDSELADVPSNDVRRQQLQHFTTLLESNIHQSKDAVAYADMMGVTYKTLNTICKTTTQKTPKQLIDAHIILEAKRRLVIDSTQVSQVAFDLGFREVTNFVKYFKKNTSETPSQFRHRLAG